MKRLLTLFFITAILILSFKSESFAATLEVCPNGGGCTYEYTGGGAVNAIQTAIDNASDGDTVYIRNGTYASPQIDMTSSHIGITIEGESNSGTILSESYFRIGSAVNGASSNITVKNLKVLNSYDVNNGIEIVNSTGIDLLNLIIEGSGGEGFKITGSATVDIYNCILTNGSSAGLRINGSGVQINAYNNNISGNTYQGVLVEDVSLLNLVNNRIGENGTLGVQVNQGAIINIKNDNVYGNGTYGLSISSVSSLVNDYNNVYGNTSGGYTGAIGTGIHSISVDPDIGANGILNCTSDLINAGDPSITDTDGTISDIGMYGGPYSDFNSVNFLCIEGLFCNVTEEVHECIQCLSDTDCIGDATCNLNTNFCEEPVIDDVTDSPGEEEEETNESEDDNTVDNEILPQTIGYRDDPVFYTILVIFMVLVGYLLYAQKKYRKDERRY